jgi:hypothetical protein
VDAHLPWLGPSAVQVSADSYAKATLARKCLAEDGGRIMTVSGTSVLNYFGAILWHTQCLMISRDRQAEGSAVLVQTAMRHLAAVNCTCIAFWHFTSPVF